MRKNIFSILLLAIFAAWLTGLPTVANAQQNGIPDYKVSWQALDYMTISVPITGWSRDMLALGPASWSVDYKTRLPGCQTETPNCYTLTASEKWSIHDPALDDCFSNYNRTNCNGSTPDRAKWLWATGGCVFQEWWSFTNSCGTTGVNAWDPSFEIKPIGEPELYRNNCTFGQGANAFSRGDGPGIVWEHDDSCDGTTAIWAQGPYGYAKGSIDQTTNRAGINFIGTLIPLRWQVSGFND